MKSSARTRLFVREGRDVVLKSAELGDDVRRKNVGPHREQLAELDECRAELVEEFAEVTSALRRCFADDLAVLADEVGQPVAVEEVAEAVAEGDLGDLGDAPQASRRRLSHGVSVARGASNPSLPAVPGLGGGGPRARCRGGGA